MANIEFWPDLTRAWQTVPDAVHEDAKTVFHAENGGDCQVLKTESRARVLRLTAEGHVPLVLKIYRTPPQLAWRTFGLASRANREFTVMMNAHRLGLPVVRPRYWLERRVRGCVQFSAIALDTVNGPDLESWLLDDRVGQPQRVQAAATTGDLLGQFHRAGLFWGTVSPRNLMLAGDDISGMIAIDMPYARLHGLDITGQAHAMMDLGFSLLLSDGRAAFDEQARSALILAYCLNDPDRARAVDERLRLPLHREWKRKRLLRRLGNLLSPGARSKGRGGVYDRETGAYRVLDNEAVFLYPASC